MECAADIRKCLYAKVVLSDSVAMFQVISKQMSNQCDVSYASDSFLFPVTVSVEVSFGAKLAQAEGKCWLARRFDTVTLLHIPFLLSQSWCAHLIALPSHSRCLKFATK